MDNLCYQGMVAGHVITIGNVPSLCQISSAREGLAFLTIDELFYRMTKDGINDSEGPGRRAQAWVNPVGLETTLDHQICRCAQFEEWTISQ